MRIDVGGYALDATVHPAPPPKRTAILLHGFAGTKDDWTPVLPAFTRNTHAVALDLIGHGASDAPEDPHAYGFEPVADALLKVADHVGAAAPIWVGYSLGARLALYLAIRHPQRVGGLVLESVHEGLADPAERAARQRQDQEDARTLETKGVAAFLDAWHARPVFDSRRRNTGLWQAEVAKKLSTNRPRPLAHAMRGLGLGAMPDLGRRLGEVQAPTLVLAGTLDAPYLAHGRRVASKVRDARFKAVLNAGHGVHAENPQAYAEAVGDFLRTLYELEPARGM